MKQNLTYVLLQREINSFKGALSTLSRVLDEMIEDKNLKIKSDNDANDHKEILETILNILTIDSSIKEVKEKVEILLGRVG